MQYLLKNIITHYQIAQKYYKLIFILVKNYILKKKNKQEMNKIRRICLFDVDGTLTKSRNKIETSMIECLNKLKKVMDIGYVGGSDLHKIKWQLGQQGVQLGKYLFSQNGLLAFQGHNIIGQQQIGKYLGQQRLKKFINFCLRYLSQIDIPVKRGTFIQYRTGLINVSPIGRNCSQKQRDQFQIYDKEHNIRKKFIEQLQKNFADYNLVYSIGGQISFDVFPKGWDKTYCLRYLKDYQQIFFFGDKTFPGGNDFQLYDLLVKDGRAFSVKTFHDTIQIINQKFLNQQQKEQ